MVSRILSRIHHARFTKWRNFVVCLRVITRVYHAGCVTPDVYYMGCASRETRLLYSRRGAQFYSVLCKEIEVAILSLLLRPSLLLPLRRAQHTSLYSLRRHSLLVSRPLGFSSCAALSSVLPPILEYNATPAIVIVRRAARGNV